MADKLSIEEFAAEIKKRRPDLASIPNDTLVGKTLGAAPELKEFVNLDTAMPAPEGILSQLFGHLGVQKSDPATPMVGISPAGMPIMNGAQPSVASEGAAQSLLGMGKTVAATPGALWDAFKLGTGGPATLLSGLRDAYQGAKSGASNMASTLTNPPPPESSQWPQVQQQAGGMLASAELPNAVAGAGQAISPLVRALGEAFPSADRAGANLNQVRQAAATVPVDLSNANNVIDRASELRDTGHGPLSAGMRKLIAAQQPTTGDFAGTPVTMQPDPINYPESFDFASAAKKLASRERQAQTGMMQAQVKQFAGALQDANRAAATQVGMGDLFDSAMKEYSQAKSLENAMTVAKKYAVRAAIGAGLYGGYRELTK